MKGTPINICHSEVVKNRKIYKSVHYSHIGDFMRITNNKVHKINPAKLSEPAEMINFVFRTCRDIAVLFEQEDEILRGEGKNKYKPSIALPLSEAIDAWNDTEYSTSVTKGITDIICKRNPVSAKPGIVTINEYLKILKDKDFSKMNIPDGEITRLNISKHCRIGSAGAFEPWRKYDVILKDAKEIEEFLKQNVMLSELLSSTYFDVDPNSRYALRAGAGENSCIHQSEAWLSVHTLAYLLDREQTGRQYWSSAPIYSNNNII